MAWLARDPERRQSPRTLWPEAQSVIVLGMNYGPDEDPLASLARRDRATISVYARHRDYHDLIKGRLKQLAEPPASRSRRRGQGVRRHRTGAREAARPAGSDRLAGQAQQPGLADFRLLAVPRRDFLRPAARAGPARGRSLRLVPGLPRRLPDRRLPGALPARCAALHLVPDDRAQGPYRRTSSAPRSAIGSMAATTASRCARGTSSRASRARPGCRRATICAPRRWPTSAGSTMRPSGRALPARRSSAPGAIASCATC